MKNRIVSVFLLTLMLTALFPPYDACAAQAFTDVNKHWAKDYINQLAGQNLIAGYPDGTFKPDYPMTKAEFTSLLITSMGISSTDKSSKTFSDTGSHWGRAFINEAVKKGILVPSEYPEGLKPDTSIKRSEVCAMLIRALSLSPASGTTSFSDQPSIDQSMYKGYIKAAVNLGLLTGYPDNTFNAFGNMKRGEICTVVTGFLAKQGTPLASSSSIKTVVIGESEYSISEVRLTFKADNQDIAITRLDTISGVLQVNGQYNYPLNTTVGNPDVVVFNKRFGIHHMQASGDKLTIMPSYAKINSLNFNNQNLPSNLIKLYTDNVDANAFLSQLDIIDENSVTLNNQVYSLANKNVSIVLDNQLYVITKISLMANDNIPQLKPSGITAAGGSGSGGYLTNVVFFNENQLYFTGPMNQVSIQAGGVWTTFDKISSDNPGYFAFGGLTYNFIGSLIIINQIQFLITDTALHGRNQQLDIVLRKL